MTLSFQSNGGGRGSGHSSWSQCFCEGAKLRDLLSVLDHTHVRCDLTRATPNMEHTHSDQHTVLHYHRLDRTAAQAYHQLEKVHGLEALSRKTCCRWFEKFDSGDHSMKDLSRSAAPVVYNRARILRVVQANPMNGVRE